MNPIDQYILPYSNCIPFILIAVIFLIKWSLPKPVKKPKERHTIHTDEYY